VLNIAEGAGKFSPADKAAFYARSRGSVTESAAVIDVCMKLELVNQGIAQENKERLERLAQMLTKLVKSQKENG
jgi:four helix bundle protein